MMKLILSLLALISTSSFARSDHFEHLAHYMNSFSGNHVVFVTYTEDVDRRKREGECKKVGWRMAMKEMRGLASSLLDNNETLTRDEVERKWNFDYNHAMEEFFFKVVKSRFTRCEKLYALEGEDRHVVTYINNSPRRLSFKTVFSIEN
jgi:hypothetical protein